MPSKRKEAHQANEVACDSEPSRTFIRFHGKSVSRPLSVAPICLYDKRIEPQEAGRTKRQKVEMHEEMRSVRQGTERESFGSEANNIYGELESECKKYEESGRICNFE